MRLVGLQQQCQPKGLGPAHVTSIAARLPSFGGGGGEGGLGGGGGKASTSCGGQRDLMLNAWTGWAARGRARGLQAAPFFRIRPGT